MRLGILSSLYSQFPFYCQFSFSNRVMSSVISLRNNAADCDNMNQAAKGLTFKIFYEATEISLAYKL